MREIDRIHPELCSENAQGEGLPETCINDVQRMLDVRLHILYRNKGIAGRDGMVQRLEEELTDVKRQECTEIAAGGTLLFGNAAQNILEDEIPALVCDPLSGDGQKIRETVDLSEQLLRQVVCVDVDSNALRGGAPGIAAAVWYTGRNNDDVAGRQMYVGAVDDIKAVTTAEIVELQYRVQMLQGHAEGWRPGLCLNVETDRTHSLFVKGIKGMLESIAELLHAGLSER